MDSGRFRVVVSSDFFESHGGLAQLVAHLLCKQGVRGSSPLASTIKTLLREGLLFTAEMSSNTTGY